jgi:hypothetical protein
MQQSINTINNPSKHIRLYSMSLRRLLLVISARSGLYFFSSKGVTLSIILNITFYVKLKNLANI